MFTDIITSGKREKQSHRFVRFSVVTNSRKTKETIELFIGQVGYFNRSKKRKTTSNEVKTSDITSIEVEFHRMTSIEVNMVIFTLIEVTQ